MRPSWLWDESIIEHEAGDARTNVDVQDIEEDDVMEHVIRTLIHMNLIRKYCTVA